MLATLPLARPARARSRERPDVAHAARTVLVRLRDALRLAARFRDRVRRLEAAAARKHGGVPPLFFFDRAAQAEWAAARPAAGPFPGPFVSEAGRRDPAAAAAWAALPGLTADALTVLSACALTRRAARAVPGLSAAAAALAADCRPARDVAALLAMPEDEVFRVIHPAARTGFRVTTRGVADVNQFHALLADAVTGSPARGFLPGARPSSRVLDAYQAAPVASDPPVATARFQLYRPSALRPDGTLPPGFAGADHWLWGREPLAAVPRLDDERTILLGDPVVRHTWDAVRTLSRVAGELDLVEVLSAAAVADWIADRTGRVADGAQAGWRRTA